MKFILIFLFVILLFLISRKFAVKKQTPYTEPEVRKNLKEKLAANPKLNALVKSEMNAPVSESLAFTTHKELFISEFDFLIKDYAFVKSLNEWKSREFHTVFSKDNIEVIINFESDNLPTVIIINTLLPYDEAKGKFNADIVEKYSPELIKLVKQRTERRSPKVQRMLEELRETDNIDMTELTLDYIETGQEEHKKYMKLAAGVVKKNIDNKTGVIGKS